jgi:hypothetical protein
MRSERSAVYNAPSGTVPANARARALEEAETMHGRPRPSELNHPWKPYGIGPLQSADEGYDSVNVLGLVELAGRITDFWYDPIHDDLYACLPGGVWRSDDQAAPASIATGCRRRWSPAAPPAGGGRIPRSPRRVFGALSYEDGRLLLSATVARAGGGIRRPERDRLQPSTRPIRTRFAATGGGSADRRRRRTRT